VDCIDGHGSLSTGRLRWRIGYENLNAVLNDPKHLECKEMKEWLGLKKNQTWYALEFDVEKAQKAIKKI